MTLMAILTHGSDTRLAPTLAPIVKATDGTVRTALQRIAGAGFGAVQLDATLAGARPRDLDGRARRDFAATVARAGLGAAGLDLFIPRKHFADASHVDRAMTALLAAVELAADLGRLPLSVALPVHDMSDDTRDAVAEAADGHSVPIAVHAEDQFDDLLAWLDEVDQPTLGPALNPATVLASGGDPADAANRLSKQLLVARLCDWTDTGDAGGAMTVVGQGDLDVIPYRLSVDMCATRRGPVVLDLRRLDAPLAAAEHALQTWDSASFTI